MSEAIPSGVALGVVGLMGVVALLLPLSSTFLLAGVSSPILGPMATFLALSCATIPAAVISYSVGKRTGQFVPERFRGKLLSAEVWLREYKGAVFPIALLVKAVPNPLFDAWGYAFGAVRASFIPFLVGYVLGTSFALSLVCFASFLVVS